MQQLAFLICLHVLMACALLTHCRHFCKSPARANAYKQLVAAAGLEPKLPQRVVPSRWLCIVKPLERLIR